MFPSNLSDYSISVEEAASELRRLLVGAAQIRFSRSDVPVGAYLSGGIDSSICSTIINEYTDIPLIS